MVNINTPGSANRNSWYNMTTSGSAGQVAQRQQNANMYGDWFKPGYATSDNGGGGGAGGGGYGYGSGMAGGAYGQPASGFPGGTGTLAPGAGTGAVGSGDYTTSIDANPIWNENQIQGAVNQQGAQIDAGAQQAGQRQSQQLAGRGMGATGGGLGAALRAALGSNARAQKATGEQTLRSGMATQNAQHLLGAQTARAGEGVSLGNMLLSQRGQDISADNASKQQLLSMIMSTMGGMS